MLANFKSESAAQSSKAPDTGSSANVTAPAVSLPKGGGAIRGIGEKFAANPVNGTGSLTIPIATSPGRSGFAPQLALSYDSGSGNGPFGLGWNLSLPSITRKTDKGLPQYRDAEESDVFLLSAAEDLVPHLIEVDGNWLRESLPVRVVDDVEYRVTRYRPRVEGLFARIERWTRVSDGDAHWRSISRDNVLTIYGKDQNSRIADPQNAQHIFSWLICETRDDKGNAIVYEYKPEDSDGINLASAHEHHRSSDQRRANRYIKHIKYGNRAPLLDTTHRRPHFLDDDALRSVEWMFEVVFDYGEGHYEELALDPGQTPAEQHRFIRASTTTAGTWPVRSDPFSTYRSGFEVRTYRLCRRVLMFHHFTGELGIDDCLVRSTDFTFSETPIASFITSVSQSGYVRQPDAVNQDRYLKKSLPPVDFEYSRVPTPEELALQPIQIVDDESIQNLPSGLDGSNYQWVDLDGEGVPGLLTEQPGGWYYKRNLSPLTEDGASFGPLEQIARLPATANDRQQFIDLAGDGQLDRVDLSGPTPGFYERTNNADWFPFRYFTSLPCLNWNDPNLRFVDLTGDGHADVLITEDDVLTWYPSLAEEGFANAHSVRLALNEEKGPRVVFADATQSIHLADLSGDGLSDLVRIRNGEVCYWPNLGYGRFGAKVTMDHSPWFDAPDQFDQKRIRLADTDGSGVTDILYVRRDGVQIYFNESGNSWSDAVTVPQLSRVDDLASVQALDLLGNGTACLVWSSPLAKDAARPMRYIELMGRQKPHLLVRTANNLGTETRIRYAPSTRFYVQDKLAGKPWITKLPFPVHCVEKVTVTDGWRQTEFSTTYSYHHGYFDGVEREFRGFGRVDQIDVESYGVFEQGNTASPFITDDRTLYQPPVQTVTWFHTGATVERAGILSQFAYEYFPDWFEQRRPDSEDVLGGFLENPLPEPDVVADGLTATEWREAMRACKGMALRQEVYELDVDALERGEHRKLKIFSAATHNCHIRRLQPQASNRHAVFLVTESEAVNYHYELDLRPDTVRPDPRIAHTLNLATDQYGNVLQSVAVMYPRFGFFDDSSLSSEDQERVRSVQRERHISYTENRYTRDHEDEHDYRLRVPCEVMTYELTGINPEDESDRTSADPRDNRYFTLDELRRYQLSAEYPPTGEPVSVTEIPYQQIRDPATPQKRCVEHVRMCFFRDDLNGALPFRQLGRLGLPYETYTLALTEELLHAVFADKLTPDVAALLADATVSGYLSGPNLAERFSGLETSSQYWRRSGISGFADDAADHFYLPERYIDPFDNVTHIEYDSRDLFVQSSRDARGNTTRVMQFDYRVLAPREIRDANDNLSEVYFDVLGLPAAMAAKGKGAEADNLEGFDDASANPSPAELARFFTAATYDEPQARRWLGNATARHLYYFGEIHNADGSITWSAHPSCACGIVREQHVSEVAESPLQTAFEYSDGAGNVLVKKVQAEPEREDGPLRWIASGKTVLNNKGKPVKQYEPYFSLPEVGHRFEEPRQQGVTPVFYYDAVGRVVRTESPDGSYSRVEFSPWHVTTYDQNDTLLEAGNSWFARRSATTSSVEDQRAARLASEHSATPAVTILDSLGRDVIAIAHNRTRDDADALRDVRSLTFTKLDAEGKPLWVRDARGNLVMQYITPPKPARAADDQMPSESVPCYDIAGNLLFQHSMDAGDRWMLNDAAGKPMLAWDFNERFDETGTAVAENRIFHTRYDSLHRPIEHWLTIDSGEPQLIERFIYGEPLDTGPDEEAKRRNLRGQLHQHFDASGLVTNVRFDFKNNLLEVQRTLASAYQAPVIDWREAAALESETFTQVVEYDALNRMTRQYNWHRGNGSRVAVYEPRYNARGLLASEQIVLRARKTGTGYEESSGEGFGTSTTVAISSITYNAKGQTEIVRLGNGTITRYEYDRETFRLARLRTARSREPRLIQDLQYTYDPVGNITEIRDDAQQTAYFANAVVEPHCQYEYDALYRLTRARGREHAWHNVQRDAQDIEPSIGIPFPNSSEALQNYEERYVYDEVGNILSLAHTGGRVLRWKRCYQYALDSNRLLATGGAGEFASAGDPCPSHYVSDPTLSQRYAYDTHGNMLNLNRTSEVFRLRWDYRDMIHTANLGGGGFAYYNYDATKERTRKVITNESGVKQSERIYFGGMEIYRRFVANELAEEIETHHLFAGEQRMLIVEDVLTTRNAVLGTGPRLRYQYSNDLGSDCIELDAAAAVITYEEYHPYGTTAYQAARSAMEASLKRYSYTSKECDEETRLYYYGARYYASWLGRWTSADPADIADGFNRYVYVHNNPRMLVDPDGKQGMPYRSWISGGGQTVRIYGEPPDIRALARPPDGPQHYRISGNNIYWRGSGATVRNTGRPSLSRSSGNTAATQLPPPTTQNANNVDLGLGIATGAAQSLAPGGFLANPALDRAPGATREFQTGRAAGQMITGIAQVFAGLSLAIGGGALAVGGAAGSPFTLGGSLVATVVGGGAVVAGLVTAAHGVINVVAGVMTATHAMSMSAGGNEGGSGSPSGGAGAGSNEGEASNTTNEGASEPAGETPPETPVEPEDPASAIDPAPGGRFRRGEGAARQEGTQNYQRESIRRRRSAQEGEWEQGENRPRQANIESTRRSDQRAAVERRPDARRNRR